MLPASVRGGVTGSTLARAPHRLSRRTGASVMLGSQFGSQFAPVRVQSDVAVVAQSALNCRVSAFWDVAERFCLSLKIGRSAVRPRPWPPPPTSVYASVGRVTRLVPSHLSSQFALVEGLTTHS